MSPLIDKQSYAEGDPKLLEQLRAALAWRPSYTLWLYGGMGAGKTSLVRNFLYSLGLPHRTPVVSPTYTLLNEYCIGNDWYAHLDLYRANQQFSMEELGVLDVRTFRGTFVEWPEQTEEGYILKPTHKLYIETRVPELRQYTLIEC